MTMRPHLYLSSLAALAIALGAMTATTASARAQDAPPAAAPDAAPQREAQTWTGDILLPGGMKLEFTAVLTPNDAGGYTGVMSIPAQGAENEPLSDVSVTAEAVRFTLAPKKAPATAWAVFSVDLNADGTVKSATLSQMGQKFGVNIRRLAAGEDPMADARPQTPRQPYPYSQRELSLVNGADGTRLVGTLFTPGQPADGEIVASERHPAVILITGSGPQDRDETIVGHKPFLVLADHLARNGIASFRMDDRGVGGSSGSLFQSSVYDLAGDIKTAFQAMRIQPDIDPNRIGLLGHSEGGAIAPLVASEVPEVRFIVLLAGTGVPGRDVMTHQAGLIMKASGADEATIEKQTVAHRALMDAVTTGADDKTIDEAIRKLVEAQAMGQEVSEDQMFQIVSSQRTSLKTPWFMSFMIHDPRVPLRSVRCSVLAMNGELDLQVDPEQNLTAIEQSLREGGNQDVTAIRLEGLNHLFQPTETGLPGEYGSIPTTFDPAALDVITQWLRKRSGLD